MQVNIHLFFMFYFWKENVSWPLELMKFQYCLILSFRTAKPHHMNKSWNFNSDWINPFIKGWRKCVVRVKFYFADLVSLTWKIWRLITKCCAAHCTRLFHYPDCAGYTTENMNQSKETAVSGSEINVCQARRTIYRSHFQCAEMSVSR